jgi:hypothetical protein
MFYVSEASNATLVGNTSALAGRGPNQGAAPFAFKGAVPDFAHWRTTEICSYAETLAAEESFEILRSSERPIKRRRTPLHRPLTS